MRLLLPVTTTSTASASPTFEDGRVHLPPHKHLSVGSEARGVVEAAFHAHGNGRGGWWGELALVYLPPDHLNQPLLFFVDLLPKPIIITITATPTATTATPTTITTSTAIATTA
jgi:hypothetical protein